MHKTSKSIFEEIASERPPCERAAFLKDHVCAGRSTMEHAFIYAGKQIPDKWAIVRLCEYAHSVGPYVLNGILDKRINRWLALRNATKEDFKKYPKVDWVRMKNYLHSQYASTILRSRCAEREAANH